MAKKSKKKNKFGMNSSDDGASSSIRIGGRKRSCDFDRDESFGPAHQLLTPRAMKRQRSRSEYSSGGDTEIDSPVVMEIVDSPIAKEMVDVIYSSPQTQKTRKLLTADHIAGLFLSSPLSGGVFNRAMSDEEEGYLEDQDAATEDIEYEGKKEFIVERIENMATKHVPLAHFSQFLSSDDCITGGLSQDSLLAILDAVFYDRKPIPTVQIENITLRLLESKNFYVSCKNLPETHSSTAHDLRVAVRCLTSYCLRPQDLPYIGSLPENSPDSIEYGFTDNIKTNVGNVLLEIYGLFPHPRVRKKASPSWHGEKNMIDVSKQIFLCLNEFLDEKEGGKFSKMKFVFNRLLRQILEIIAKLLVIDRPSSDTKDVSDYKLENIKLFFEKVLKDDTGRISITIKPELLIELWTRFISKISNDSTFLNSVCLFEETQTASGDADELKRTLNNSREYRTKLLRLMHGPTSPDEKEEPPKMNWLLHYLTVRIPIFTTGVTATSAIQASAALINTDATSSLIVSAKALVSKVQLNDLVVGILKNIFQTMSSSTFSVIEAVLENKHETAFIIAAIFAIHEHFSTRPQIGTAQIVVEDSKSDYENKILTERIKGFIRDILETQSPRGVDTIAEAADIFDKLMADNNFFKFYNAMIDTSATNIPKEEFDKLTVVYALLEAKPYIILRLKNTAGVEVDTKAEPFGEQEILLNRVITENYEIDTNSWTVSLRAALTNLKEANEAIFRNTFAITSTTQSQTIYNWCKKLIIEGCNWARRETTEATEAGFGSIMRPYRKHIVSYKGDGYPVLETAFGRLKIKDDKQGLYVRGGGRKWYLYRWGSKVKKIKNW